MLNSLVAGHVCVRKRFQQRKIVGATAILAGIAGRLLRVHGGRPDTQRAGAFAGGSADRRERLFRPRAREVGTVSAVTVGQDGHITEIRLTTSSRLGLGERTVAVRQDSFIALDGAVVLDLSAEEVDALPAQTALRGSPA